MTGTSDRETHTPNGHTHSGRLRAAGATRRRRVLIAEDHGDTRFMLRVFLEARGFDVVEAVNGEEAICLCESARPDVVLLDGGLPRIDGLGVISRIRSDYTSPRLPVVFLSGHAEEVAQRAAFDAGCDDYLTKPFQLEQLSAVLTRLLAGPPGHGDGTNKGGFST
jgi:two-component system KDP operon response regulator KdpE